MSKDRKKYSSKTIRLQNWDYSWAGSYFITICTKDRKHYFGTIENGQPKLSSVGIIADLMWHEIRNHAKHVALREFIVMPNHIHGILVLHPDPVDPPVEKMHAFSLRGDQKTIGQKRFQNQGKNTVSSIIGGYKSAVTKHARRLGFEFAWQPRFWDHIIREENSYQRIARYIKNNPKKWENDKLNGGKGNIVLEPSADYNAEEWMI